jgi:isopentenyl phosphate kinase
MIQRKHSIALFLVSIVAQLYLIKANEREIHNVMLIKIGGSSVTVKDQKETFNETIVKWFTETIADVVSPFYRMGGTHDCALHEKPAVILVHGAGSFGHHTAKEFHLKGYPHNLFEPNNNTMEGLAKTRHSVQKLNQRIVAELLSVGVKAVGISPCFGGLRNLNQFHEQQSWLIDVIRETLRAGLVPVLHGDACLYGSSAAILSGDTLVQMCSPLANQIVFFTDVDGVFQSDPKTNPTAQRIPEIPVDSEGNLVSSHVIQATESSHSHDVTGGLKVSFLTRLAASNASHKFL